MSNLIKYLDVHSLAEGLLKGMASPAFVYGRDAVCVDQSFELVKVEVPQSFKRPPMEADWMRVGSDLRVALSKYEQEQQATRTR